MTKPSTESQLKAARTYYKAHRAGKRRAPAIYLTDEQAAALDKLAQHYGSKTAGILAAINNEAERIGTKGEQQ